MKNAGKIIRYAVLSAKKRGLRVVQGKWGVVSNGERFYCSGDELCALGAVVDGKRAIGCTQSTVARVLSKPNEWVSAFISGFDGGVSRKPSAGFLMGQKIRDELRGEGVL